MQQDPSRRERGFTLVEIMVVVVILGLLAGVGIVQVRKYLKDAKLKLAAQRCAEIENAIELEENSGGVFDNTESIIDALLEAKAIKSEGTTDPWGTRLEIRRDEEGQYYAISAGEDKQFDTGDDVRRKGPVGDNEDF